MTGEASSAHHGAVTQLDVVILVAAAVSAIGGSRRGFVLGALALAGFAGGVLLATALTAAFAEGERASPLPALLALTAGLLGSAMLAAVGARLRRRWSRSLTPRLGTSRLTRRAASASDRVLGGLLSAGVVLGLAWLAGAAASQPAAPALLREAVRESVVLTRLTAALPPAAPILAALPRFDPIPRLRGPSAQVVAPPRGVARDPDIRAAAPSVVRIVGMACGRGMSGSGWVAAPGLVVTNAHVVAGQTEPLVAAGDEMDLHDSVVVAFDRRDDVAVLRVSGLAARALPMARDAKPGTPAAMLGYPRNGPYSAVPARLGETRWLLTGGASGASLARRTVTLFRAVVHPGNSGGPLVDRSGRVVATVFAARKERRSRTGFAVPNRPVRRVLADVGDDPVATGSCDG